MSHVRYHLWTAGCQMNVADSQRVAAELEKLGYRRSATAEQADVIVLNTCVVRQSAEDRAIGRLSSLRPLKEQRPELVINLMGCMVGVKPAPELRQAFPYVDVFSPPSDPGPLLDHLLGRQVEANQTTRRFQTMDGELMLPLHERGRLVSAHVPVVYGCSHACTFCVIPFRRGPERSRPADEIVDEVRSLVAQGVREVTLLGQIVDRYQHQQVDLSQLLRQVDAIEGLHRVRFLTSHPNWMTTRLLETVAELDKVCPHIEVPIQAGDDTVLARMKRGYRARDYRRLVGEIRSILPDGSIATDVIVGFPGESPDQYQQTYDLLAELKLDVAHLARYSPRPRTVSARRMEDDVPEQEKMRRFRQLEALQESVSAEINAGYVGETVDVLVEKRHKGRWMGRTPTHKLVFFGSPRELRGELVQVRIANSGAWSLRGELEPTGEVERLVPLSLSEVPAPSSSREPIAAMQARQKGAGPAGRSPDAERITQ